MVSFRSPINKPFPEAIDRSPMVHSDGLSPVPLLTADASQRLQHIRQICQGIPPGVRVMAVTKTVPADQVRLAYGAGIRDFGENRIQEALPKQEELQDLKDVTWHFIGRLQSNKVRKAIEQFDWIHTVDSLKLAERLHRIAQELGRSPQVSLQVKLRPDDTKGGWPLPDLVQALPQLQHYDHLRIGGIMVIPPRALSPGETLTLFQEAHRLFQDLQRDFPPAAGSPFQWQHLSLGMSNDYPLALESGTTLVRLGSLLFGDRRPQA